MGARYDLVVIGSGPAGQKAAISAAKQGKRVVAIDRPDRIGGVSLHTGTIPSKTLREAVLYLSGFRQRTFYGKDYRLKEKIAVSNLSSRVRPVLQHEMEVVRAQLKRNDIEMVFGSARFEDPHTLLVTNPDGRDERVEADHVFIGCGTRPAEHASVPIDGKKIFNSDQLAHVEQIPKHLVIVGGGVIGLEYASMLTALGGEVTLIDARKRILDFVDEEIVDTLTYHMRRHGVTFRLGEKVSACATTDKGIVATLESGKTVHADALLYAVGRQANTDRIAVENAGLEPDARGRIEVNEHFQTKVPHIYAAGDCIGFPSLASVSMEQGRVASLHMFGKPARVDTNLLPYGIYTIPEISMVGRSEQDLTAAKIPYEVGLARYDELAKAQMVGDQIGLLKILFDPTTLKVLGVHAIGENAAEIIHIGQAVLTLGATVEYFRDTVFNYPTLAEAYKVAALDGLNKLPGLNVRFATLLAAAIVMTACKRETPTAGHPDAGPKPPRIGSGEPSPDAFTVIVTRTQMIAEDKPILPLPTRDEIVRAGIGDKSQPSPMTITPLLVAAREARARKAPSSNGDAILVIEGTTPYRLLTEVLFTLGEAEYSRHYLMVLMPTVGKGDAGAKPAAVDAGPPLAPLAPLPQSTAPLDKAIGLHVFVSDAGVSFRTADGAIGPACEGHGPGVTVPKRGGGHDVAAITRCARSLKPKGASDDAVSIGAEPATDYDVIIAVVDALRRDAAEDLFPQAFFEKVK